MSNELDREELLRRLEEAQKNMNDEAARALEKKVEKLPELTVGQADAQDEKTRVLEAQHGTQKVDAHIEKVKEQQDGKAPDKEAFNNTYLNNKPGIIHKRPDAKNPDGVPDIPQHSLTDTDGVPDKKEEKSWKNPFQTRPGKPRPE